MKQCANELSREQLIASMLMADRPFINESMLVQAAHSFYSKLIIADQYKVEAKYQGAITLIKAMAGHTEADGLGDDFGLSKVCAPIFNIYIIGNSK